MRKIDLFSAIKLYSGIKLKKPLMGPPAVAINLTNKCFSNCIMCSSYTPLNKNRFKLKENELELTWGIIDPLLKDLSRLKTKFIVLAGNGDPLCHKDFIGIIRRISEYNMRCVLFTSAVNLSENLTREMCESNSMDRIKFSLHAGSNEVFKKIHPLIKSDKVFDNIKKQLVYIKDYKNENNSDLPKIEIINIVMKPNYGDVKNMINLGLELGADSIFFTGVGTESFTKCLRLEKNELQKVEKKLVEYKKKLKNKINIDISQLYMGDYLDYLEKKKENIKVMPERCYVGFYNSMVLVDGKVSPCCGCWHYYLGDLNKTSFYELWNSEKYQKFRVNALKMDESIINSLSCRCWICSDYHINEEINNIMNSPLKVFKEFIQRLI